MIAGTLATCAEPVDEPLSPWIRGEAGLPAIEVTQTQDTHGAATPQAGTAAARVDESVTDVLARRDDSNGVLIDTDRTDAVTDMATDWYADVTGSGVILAESISANEQLPFPFDLFTARVATSVERQQLDIEALYDDWDGADGLAELWMSGSDIGPGTQIAYHGAADDHRPTIGLGFKRAWSGTTIKGVAYASGYVALYTARHPADGLQFVADEILPHAEAWDPVEHEDQADFDDFGGGD